MLKAVSRIVDRLRGSGEAAVTVPSMDGALRPNVRIENAVQMHTAEAPDNLVEHGGEILFSSGANILVLGLQSGKSSVSEQLSSEVTCLASHPCGSLAIGIAEGGVFVRGGAHDGTLIADFAGQRMPAATAASFETPDSLLVCFGSHQFSPEEWERDLMTKNASGSVWRVDLGTLRSECLANGLAYPYGVAVGQKGEVSFPKAGDIG